MGYPTHDEARIYKSKTIQSQIRAAVELDYPVFSGTFHDDFNGAGLPDSTKWFINHPSWGLCTQWVGALWIGTSSAGIASSWIQSKHNLAFPLRRDTDWEFRVRAAAATITGYGNFIRICGRSFRDCEAIWAVKANLADGLHVNMPDGFSVQNTRWNNGLDVSFNRYRVIYDASAQTYTCYIDADDDGTYEIGPFTENVNGRYADAIVIGNSTAIQGALGDFTEWHVDWVDITGTAESIVYPDWAAPFTYDGTRFSYLPTVLSGHVSCDKQNVVDAATLELDNFYRDERMEARPKMYADMRFLNRRGIIEGRATDGAGNWTPWEMLLDGLCAEKQIELDRGGRCTLSLPMRDRWRARADDMEILACYADPAAPIQGVDCNMTVQEIIEDIYQVKCGLPAASHNVQATPNMTPRNYNVFRQSAQSAVKTIADHGALGIWQRRSDARIEVADYDWGSDDPQYRMHTAEEILFVRWTESAFDVTSAEQLGIENTNLGIPFEHVWPPHREPYHGRLIHSNAVSLQTSVDHDNRPISALIWWIRNRNLGSVEVTAPAQFWVEHDLEVSVIDNIFLGLKDDQYWMIDGWEHRWSGEEVCVTRIRFINLHPDIFLRTNLVEE